MNRTIIGYRIKSVNYDDWYVYGDDVYGYFFGPKEAAKLFTTKEAAFAAKWGASAKVVRVIKVVR